MRDENDWRHQSTYATEVHERSRRKRRPDSDDPPEGSIIWIETAYRRGVQQGAHFVVELMLPFLPWVIKERVKDYVYRKLYRWRFSKHNGKFTEPPRE